MIRMLIVVLLLAALCPEALAAQRQTMTLSQKCALASTLIRDNRCDPITCDEGLGRALRAGCHIHHWGHVPR